MPDDSLMIGPGTVILIDPYPTWTEIPGANPPCKVRPMQTPDPGTKVMVRDGEGQDGGIEPNGPVTVDYYTMTMKRGLYSEDAVAAANLLSPFHDTVRDVRHLYSDEAVGPMPVRESEEGEG